MIHSTAKYLDDLIRRVFWINLAVGNNDLFHFYLK